MHWLDPMPARRRVRVLMLALTLPFAARTADAGQSARLVYSRTGEAASCGDEHGLRRAVARRLGYDPFVAASMNTVVADLRAEGAGLRAHVYVIHDGNTAGASRELSSRSRDCTELLAAVALAISIAVDPDALDRVEQAERTSETKANTAEPPLEQPRENSSNPSGLPAPAGAASAAPTPSADITVWPKPAPSTREPDAPSASFDVGIGAFGAKGPAPLMNYGAWLSLGARFGNWQLRLQPEFTLPSDSDQVAGASVRVSTYGGNLSAGFSWQHLYLGALFDVVALSGRGQGVTQPSRHTVAHAAAGTRVGYHVALGRHFALVPSLDGLMSFRRVEMQLNHGAGYTSPRVFVRLGFSVEYQF